MRVTVLTTGTNNTKVIYGPLAELGHALSIITYDEMPSHEELPAIVRHTGADAVVYIGALAGYHGKPVPGVEVLGEIGARSRLVHICCDGAEPVWWPTLDEYYARGRFALQVNIDGVRTGPIGERGITTLCPVSPTPYADARPWSTRKVKFGFGGNSHHGTREAMLNVLVERGLLDWRRRDEESPEGYQRYMMDCRAAWNHPMTGGTTSKHVKARFLEAALAGCLVFEEAGSPAEKWFRPGVDYISYRSADDVESYLRLIDEPESSYQDIAFALRDKIMREHSPAAFWNQVFYRLGIAEKAPPPLLQPPYVYWERAEPGPPPAPPPRLLQTHGHVNLVQVDGRVLAVPHAVGPVQLDRIDLKDYPLITSHESLAAALAALNLQPPRNQDIAVRTPGRFLGTSAARRGLRPPR